MPSSPPPAEPAPAATPSGAARPLRALLVMLAVVGGVLAGTYWSAWSYRCQFQLSFRPGAAATAPADLANYVRRQRELLAGLLPSHAADGEPKPARHLQVTMPSANVLCVQVDERERRSLLMPPTIESRRAACSQTQQAAEELLAAYLALRAKQAAPAPAATRPAMPATMPAPVASSPSPPDMQEIQKELAALRARRAELMRRRDQLDTQINGDYARHVHAARALTVEHPRLRQIVGAIDVLQTKRDDPWQDRPTRDQAGSELADRYVELKAELVRIVAQSDRQAQTLAGPIALLEAAACASQAASQPALASAAAATAPVERPAQRPEFEVVVQEYPSLPDWLHPHRPLLAAHVAASGGAGLLAGLACLRLGKRGK